MVLNASIIHLGYREDFLFGYSQILRIVEVMRPMDELGFVGET